MAVQKIGEVLYTLRTDKKIGQEELCRGLCSKTSLSRIENGERIPDRLLLNALLQRMGKSADKLSTILNAEEYRYLIWKRQALSAAGQGNMESLRALLSKPQAVEGKVNEVLQKQFYLQMEAVLAENEEHNPEKGVELQKRAADLTMPGFTSGKLNRYLISTEEMQLLLRLTEMQIVLEQEEAEELLMEIAEYAWEHYSDGEAKVRIYPRAVRLAIPLLLKKRRYDVCMLLCRRGIELLCWQGVIYDLAELMEGYLACCRNGYPGEMEDRYRKQLEALKAVYREYGVEISPAKNSFLMYSNQETYLVDEVIKRSRMDRKVSQESLSENICAPETLSRIESGRRAPNTGNFRALLDRLEVRQDYWNSELDTSDFLLLEKKRELNRAVSLKKWDEAHRLLDELKAAPGMDTPENKRILTWSESQILYMEKKLDGKNFFPICENLLNCKKEEWKKEEFWTLFLTENKVDILNAMAVKYMDERQYEKAVFIYEHILDQLERSKVRLMDRYASSILVIGNLSLCYGELGNKEACLKMCEKGMLLSLEAGRGRRFGDFFSTRAETLFIMGKKEACRIEMRQAYYLCELMLLDKSMTYIKKFYMREYGEEIE